jgi:hypothetical protein
MGPASASIGHSGLVTILDPVLAGQMASAMNDTTWGNASTNRSDDDHRDRESVRPHLLVQVHLSQLVPEIAWLIHALMAAKSSFHRVPPCNTTRHATQRTRPQRA